MINSNKFIKELFKIGISHLLVVPCSFSKGLINACINNSELIEYIPCASEAIACSIASGLVMSGEKPIVIIQSSGLTNMGSCLTSLSNPYNIFFPIICSWRSYKEGDSEIQHKHLAIKLCDLINSYGYEYEKLTTNMSKALEKVNRSFYKKNILLIDKENFSDCVLDEIHSVNLSSYPKRSSYLTLLNKLIKFEKKLVCIGTTGNTSREMHSIMEGNPNFYMTGNMGGALSIGLGSALAGKKTIICGGDAEFVMHLGGLTTTGRYGKNVFLIYIIFDNEVNKSTGGQNTYQKHINYLDLAKSCGWSVSNNIIHSLINFEKELKNIFKKDKGIFFVHVKCNLDRDYPRPKANEIINSKDSFK